ncbi:MAG: VWA domain-containing protein [Kofleriaceae bacterium]
MLLTACTHAKTPATLTSTGTPLVAAVDPNLVEMTAEPTTTLVLANAGSELGIRVRITAHDLPAAKRPALDLALVLDTSGSMEGAPIEALRASARELAGKLRDGDHLSVVVFHSKSEVLVRNVAISPANRATIDRAIANIHATGTTDLVGGLSLGLAQLTTGILPNGINRIVLLSDGVPNSSAALPQTVAMIRQAGVSVTSLGFGIDYDTTLMTQIARDTGGAFHYLEHADQVAKVFDAELVKMKSSVARNLQLEIEPGPGVTIAAMPGLAVGADGKLYAAIGDLPAGETRDLMVPIRVTARGAGSTAELAQATLHFEDVIGKSGVRERGAFVAVKASTNATAIAGAIKIDLEVARIRSAAAASILQALALARSGQLQPARQGLVAAIVIVKTAAKAYKDADLDQLVAQLEEIEQEIAQIVVLAAPQRQNNRVPQPQPQPSTAPSPETETKLRHAEDKASAVIRGEH